MPKQKNLISFTAILISGATLILFLVQLRIQYNESRLLVTPKLKFHQNYKTEKNLSISPLGDTIVTKKLYYKLLLTNKGLGPAIIKQIEYTQNHRSIEIDKFLLEKLACTSLQINRLTSLGEDEILSKNEVVELLDFSVLHDEFSISIKKLDFEMLNELFNVEVQYESIYKEIFSEDFN